MDEGKGSPRVAVRLAGPGDEHLVEAVITEAFAPFRHLYTPEAYAHTAIRANDIRERFAEGPIWLAFMGGEPAGTVSGLPDGERFYIRSMGVVPAAQGYGIGHRLLAALEEHARDEGFNKLYLYTTFVLPRAKPLYEKNGFYILRETPPEEWFGMAGIEMEKVLD